MKAVIIGKIHKEHTMEIEKLSIRIDIKDSGLIAQTIKKNGMILYTEKEYNDLKKERDFLSTKCHKLGNDIQKMESWLRINHFRILKELKEGLKWKQ